MPKYIRNLDGVRAVAIVLVLLFHFYYVVEIGWIGVQIFFVLSGYLITQILIESKESLQLIPYLKRFYWRRTLRIFPLYYAYLLGISIVFAFTKKPDIFPAIAGFLYSYTYNLQPLFGELHFDSFFPHFWSLSVEEQFYLIWPLIVFTLNKEQIKVAIVLLILGIPIFRFLFGGWIIENYANEPGEILYRFTISHFDAFAWGGSIAVFRLTEKIRSPYGVLVFSFLLLTLIGSIHLVLSEEPMPVTSIGYPIGGLSNYQHVWSYILINFFATALIICLIKENGKRSVFANIFGNRIMVELGKLSYGMYVYHWIILSAHKRFINPMIGNMLVSFVIYFMLVFLLSYASYYTFETRFLKLKDHFKS